VGSYTEWRDAKEAPTPPAAIGPSSQRQRHRTPSPSPTRAVQADKAYSSEAQARLKHPVVVHCSGWTQKGSTTAGLFHSNSSLSHSSIFLSLLVINSLRRHTMSHQVSGHYADALYTAQAKVCVPPVPTHLGARYSTLTHWESPPARIDIQAQLPLRIYIDTRVQQQGCTCWFPLGPYHSGSHRRIL